jgi:ABC-type uncharacterized transport system permease subunit
MVVMDLNQIVNAAGLILFALSSGLFVHALQRRDRGLALFKTALAALAGGTFASGWMVLQRGSAIGWNQVSGHMLAATLGLLSLMAFLRFKVRPIGAFTAPLATLTLLFQFFAAPIPAPSGSAGGSILIYAHIVTAILGQTFAIGACAVSVLYLWQRNALKKRQLDQIPAQVPAMDKLDKLLIRFVWVGFSFITLSLISGAVFVQSNSFPGIASLQAKIIWAVAVWIWYLAILISKNVLNHPGRRVAQMSLVGFFLLATSYFGMAFFRPFGGG